MTSDHDRCVKKRASELKDAGYNVKADIPGYERPDILNGSRPDIDATDGFERIIGEAETKHTENKDAQQRENLQRYANSKPNTRFEKINCDRQDHVS